MTTDSVPTIPELTVEMVKEWDMAELVAFLLDLTLGEQAPGVTKSFLIKAIMTFSEEEIKSMLDTWGHTNDNGSVSQDE